MKRVHNKIIHAVAALTLGAQVTIFYLVNIGGIQTRTAAIRGTD